MARIIYSNYPEAKAMLGKSDCYKLIFKIEEYIKNNHPESNVILTSKKISKSGNIVTTIRIGEFADVLEEYLSDAITFEISDFKSNMNIRRETVYGEEFATLKILSFDGIIYYEQRYYHKDKSEGYTIARLKPYTHSIHINDLF